MIWPMHKRIAGFVTLLALAATAASRPAFAQDADGNWFDDSAEPAQSAPPPASSPQVPAYGPQGQPMPGNANAAAPAPVDNVPETDPRALTEFRPTLDPYGAWVEDAKYGTVWVPNRDVVGDDFAPYVSAGHWSLTDDDDWYWQSDYPFGGVVFHYGRWVWVPGVGWAWVAGRRYANAWVTWRVPTDDYGYVGWAPMPPAWGWYGGSAISLWWTPPAPYVFCPSGYAFSYNVHSYIVHDRYVIHDVAAHTRNYAGGGHIAASPRVLPANSTPMRGPSLQSVHIPASSASRVSGGVAASAHFPAASSARPYMRSDGGYGSRSYSTVNTRPYSNPSSYARPSTNYSRPVNTTPYTYSRPSNYSSYHAVPQRSYSAGTSRSYSLPSTRTYSAPSSSYRAAPTHYAAPSFHSAPIHYSAPARSYSAPARSYSAPSFHSSSPHVRR